MARSKSATSELSVKMPPEGTLFAPDHSLTSPTDWLATSLALKLIAKLGGKFNLRRDVNDVLNLSARSLVWPTRVLNELQRYLSVRCAEIDTWRGVADLSPEAFLQRYGSWNSVGDSGAMYYYLDEFVKTNTKSVQLVFSTTIEYLDQQLAGTTLLVERNIGALARVLNLTEAERKVLLYAALCKQNRDLRPVLVDCKAQNAHEAYAMLADAIGVPAHEVGAALKTSGRLDLLGLIDSPIAEHNVTDLGDLMRVSDKLLSVLMTDFADDAALMAAFTQPSKATELTEADFPHAQAEMRYLTAVLKQAARTKAEGVNVLIYGAPGTGKTEFARVLAKLAQTQLYEVSCADTDGSSLTGKERYRSLKVSQNFLSSNENTLLLFDEVEDVFPPVSRDLVFGDDRTAAPGNGSISSSKAWVNQTLETNPVPTIWVCNQIHQIDPAYLRRFQFHMELKSPPREVRASMMRKALSGLELSAPFIDKLAGRKSLTPAQIQSAARFADLAKEELAESAEALIEKQLDNFDRVVGISPNAGERPIVTSYDLGLLNIESRHEVPTIIQALGNKGRGTLIFYGNPGTGKTALAEHISKKIERPLFIRRASDLVSKWVGETEQNMAAMFEDAERERAVLLLDEADSFLQNRGLAQRNDEVTEVNEMLQGMERFNGIFICTTNLLDRIDEAALRRFTFKLKFKPLTTVGREKMFVAEALNGDASALTASARAALNDLSLLTPGDFAAVKRQVDLTGIALTAQAFLECLIEEHKVKPEVREARRVGF
jgi:SpoVK/Ycf46/Vps4 family AAA+-type ATPase